MLTMCARAGDILVNEKNAVRNITKPYLQI